MKLNLTKPLNDSFKDQETGENFIYKDTLFIKIEPRKNPKMNCIALSRSEEYEAGDHEYLEFNTMCHAIDGEFWEEGT